jgi:hypothetical protein
MGIRGRSTLFTAGPLNKWPGERLKARSSGLEKIAVTLVLFCRYVHYITLFHPCQGVGPAISGESTDTRQVDVGTDDSGSALHDHRTLHGSRLCASDTNASGRDHSDCPRQGLQIVARQDSFQKFNDWPDAIFIGTQQ